MDTVSLVLPQVDVADLTLRLQEAVSPIPVVRNLLKQLQDDCHAYFRATLDADTLVHHRSGLIDNILHTLWQHLQLDCNHLALIAVGGYGRGELHPHSDIDLLLLARDEATINNNSEALQNFITLLWDLKLDIGHSVRTLDECIEEAGKDLTIITNMMESRPLAGDTSLHQSLRAATAPQQLWPAQDFFNAKWVEIQQRHKKHKSSEYNLEPNVKNSPGALRDIQTITWVTMRHFGTGTLTALQDKGFLTEFEFQRLSGSLTFLWRVRYALHMISAREEDRLLFDLQREVAELLGFEDDGNQLGVEQFMRQFYRNQLATMELCDLLLLHFNDDFMKSGQRTDVVPLNEHFVLCNGYLQLIDADLFKRQPEWLLKVFLLMARTSNAKGIHTTTIRALRDHRHLIDDDYRNNPDYNAVFMELMRNRERVVRELSRMLRYGILGAYIPEFGKIIGMMEHDLFHVYTVDDHSLRMARLLRHFRFSDVRERYPLASRLIHRVMKKEILYLTALLHDTGKSLEGDHTVNGGEIAARFCRQHNLRPTDSSMVTWLVSNHLLMSNASQRLDLNNPEDIHQFALEVGDQQHLDMLYLISVADIVSTNPKLWTPWRAEQMRELYRNTKRALRRGLGNPRNVEDVVAEIQHEAKTRLLQQGLAEERIDALWSNPGNDYFLREGVDNIIWQTLLLDQHNHSDRPLIAVRPTSEREFEGATQIFVLAKDQPNLFAVTTATLDQLNLNIQDARIMTSEQERNAVDTYIVLDENNQPITDLQRIEKIRSVLEDAISQPDQYSTIIQRRTPRALKQFQVDTQVTMSTDPATQRTTLEVVAADRPGLLAKVGAIFAEFGAEIQGAKILTEGERIHDIFYIVDHNGEPFSDAQRCEALRQAVMEGLDEQVEAQSAV
ncbi:[protein-PII] uridylyltransferase [Bacterioplanes sanyensis]|uniref:Bifunctional uridylyltransferase/uridylyl-removing enzyme n=1 Tax=Bacterioplanes sanyensis TaxID=1249553 RepID=A0A222FKE3_9GAMM|nr:[protein-PII] uridylyltransferase [Bacterioplanes sanyensis]ASP39250.1 [protein-PII] uridylyltransferase [Bacterioplanes sanyensis]